MNIPTDTGPSTSTYLTSSSKVKDTQEPIQEAIYDFGGANVKSCASIALSKSISKGLIPSGTKLPEQWTATSNMPKNIITSPSTTSIKELFLLVIVLL